MNERVGVFGGSFDPIPFGHLISARSLAERLGFSRVVLIPCGRPPYKENVRLTSAEHRLAMVRLAVEGDPLFETSDLELQREGPSYTFDTVDEFRRRLGDSVDLFWLIGGDWLPELTTWYRVAELVHQVTIVTATRPGWTPPDEGMLAEVVGSEAARKLLSNCYLTPAIDISSTDNRARIAAGRSIRYLAPERVRSYIEQHRLYVSS